VIPTRPIVELSQDGRPQVGAEHFPPLQISDLQPGSTIALDTDITLTLLHTPTDPADSLLFLLRYGDFTTLLPFENTQEAQLVVLNQLPESLTLLPAPSPGTGSWPHPDLPVRLLSNYICFMVTPLPSFLLYMIWIMATVECFT